MTKPGATSTLYGWYAAGNRWVKLSCNNLGLLEVDMAAVSLNDLGNVVVPAPAAGDFIYWNNVAGEWQNIAHATDCIGVHCFDKSARVTHSVNQVTLHNVSTALAFDTERWDTDTIHDNALNNSRLTCFTAGKYIIAGNVWWQSNATGRRILKVRLNGITNILWQQLMPGATGGFVQTIATIWELALTDYVEFYVQQTSGGNLNLEKHGDYSPEFSMARIP